MFGHPKGLGILFFTEMWERFSFYGMRAILVLFLVAKASEGGFSWTNTQALSLYGTYSMLVYLMSIPGGIIADNLLGQKKSVMAGGFLLCAGHLLMAYTQVWSFYTALTLIILGVGLLKPNISTMVGGLYPEGDHRRDAGFTIFYMGINLGSLLATLIVGFIGETYGWHYGFSLAGFGMILGQIVFIWGQKHLADVGNLEKKEIIKSTEKKEIVNFRFTKEDKDRLIVLGISFVIVMVFWMSFEQAGGFMSLYTKDFVDRHLFGWEIPASMFQSLNPLFIILFGSAVAALWIKLEDKRKKNYSAIFKMGIGTVILGLGFLFMVGASLQKHVDASGHVVQYSAMYWLVGAYLFHTIGELCLSPVALSFITKVAPKKLVSSIMGIYFAVTGLSDKLASEIGKQADKLGDLTVFAGLVIFAVVMGSLLAIFSNRISKLTHGAEDKHDLEAEINLNNLSLEKQVS